MEGPAAAYQTWAQLVYKLLTAEQTFEATDSEETLKAVINTDWGLPYLPKSASEQRKSDALMARAEEVTKRAVPEGVRFLVATVDVQGGQKSPVRCSNHGVRCSRGALAGGPLQHQAIDAI